MSRICFCAVLLVSQKASLLLPMASLTNRVTHTCWVISRQINHPKPYDGNVPSHGSGSLRAAKSSMENFTSTPFSSRESGSAFINQYERPSKGVVSTVSVFVVDEVGSVPFSTGVFLGLPRLPCLGVVDFEGVASVCQQFP